MLLKKTLGFVFGCDLFLAVGLIIMLIGSGLMVGLIRLGVARS